jgi:cytochrome oxidase Cu insertion factor (SCO1/SenC/PrrC family)
MIRKDSRLWFLAIPIAILGGAYLAAQLRAPPDMNNPVAVGARVNVAFDGLRNASAGGNEHVASGSFMLVSFGYTSCPDVCPTTLMSVHQILEKLGADAARIDSIFISLDPERDTAAVLSSYTAGFDPRIVALTGSAAAVARAAKAFHVRYVKRATPDGSVHYQIDHTAILYLLNPEHRVIAAVPELGAPSAIADTILQSVRRELSL